MNYLKVGEYALIGDKLDIEKMDKFYTNMYKTTLNIVLSFVEILRILDDEDVVSEACAEFDITVGTLR